MHTLSATAQANTASRNARDARRGFQPKGGSTANEGNTAFLHAYGDKGVRDAKGAGCDIRSKG